MKAMAAVLLSLFVLQDGESARILEKFKALRPSDELLRIYRLNWAADFASAKVRAAKEKRPIFFIAVTNITGPDTFFTGHC